MKCKDYIKSLLFCFGLACLFNLPGCYQSSKTIAPRSYQIQIESNDTFSLYKGEKFIGKCFLTDDSEIGYLIIHGKN